MLKSNQMNRRPSINELQEFTKSYFSRQCPVVRWKALKGGTQGLAARNRIYLDPRIKSDTYFGCGVGDGLFFTPKTRTKLSVREFFFATLLHEIGHFKIVQKHPKGFLLLKRRLEKEYPGDLESQVYMSEEYIKHQGKLSEFRTFLAGGHVREHMAIEDWALKEFKKQRSKTRKLTG